MLGLSDATGFNSVTIYYPNWKPLVESTHGATIKRVVLDKHTAYLAVKDDMLVIADSLQKVWFCHDTMQQGGDLMRHAETVANVEVGWLKNLRDSSIMI